MRPETVRATWGDDIVILGQDIRHRVQLEAGRRTVRVRTAALARMPSALGVLGFVPTRAYEDAWAYLGMVHDRYVVGLGLPAGRFNSVRQKPAHEPGTEMVMALVSDYLSNAQFLELWDAVNGPADEPEGWWLP